MTTKAELVEAVGELTSENVRLEQLVYDLQSFRDAFQPRIAELEAKLQQIAQEKADALTQADEILTEAEGVAADLEKATKQLDIFVRRFNGVDHEMSRIREELARLES